MKKLGILGGMGPMASQLFYNKLIANIKATCDQEHLDILLYSHATLPDRTTAIQSGNTQALLDKLVADLQFLEQSGAEVLAIPCNTSHYFYESLSKSVSVPLLNMIDLTVETLVELQPKKVAVLATEGTLATRLYQDKLEKNKIPCVELPCHIQNRVNVLIYDEIKANRLANLDNFSAIQSYLHDYEVDRVVLACTELSVFATQVQLHPSYVDALDVLTTQAIIHCGGTLR